ncbi:hypothetical protein GobsT_12990 [Gemmata obscuriglobus]|uniref:DUF262 domain-containing protein n=1 Tax=Gemmata obscuriglobus TaxID=114 RepID=A0A2Z3H9E7_9BACT|nr:DUF262 domain-containing protein [Gemmata obscuriglobus]AWM40246.1 DUF262 domain-containing protein [Gemmata obscuriglobus]QEG26558.1 hypothetical protein GobsT_12990 [Gemmata obscuriglobus]VTS01961.1 Uncharacterized protein OS=Actinoplanes friuliensis DSM 7358 GN=AFR_09160 PE=4 SV=1: DUF262 [Gemmata obscuriglobus UQM 2246]
MPIHIKNPPDAKPERISRLITRLEDGDIKIPVFQRQYVWNQRQVIELLESVYRGYPIGSLLFWLTKERLSAARDIGGFKLPDTKDQYPQNYVLDGQQRITTIYGVLMWQGDPDDDSVFDICFDLCHATPDKAFIPTPESPLPTHLRMNILFDTKKFRNFQLSLLQRHDADDLMGKADVLLETFREYSIPIVTVTEPTVEQVALIFERINSTGTKLTVFDLMIAATWSANFNLRSEFDGCIQDLAIKDYGDVSPVAMLQVLSAHISGSAKRDTILKLRSKTDRELQANMTEVREAMKRAVDFLTNELHVRSVGFLPYERQLVVMSHVFCKRPRLSVAARDVLRKWFWRTSFAERYRRGGEGLFDDDLKTVIDSFEDIALLTGFGNAPSAAAIQKTEFRKGAAIANGYVALLASAHPRNLTNGTAIDTARALSAYNRKEFHHIFPQAFLKNLGISSELTNSLANICMLSAEHNKVISDRRPSDYVAQMEADLGAEFLNVMESNLIPEAAIPFLKSDDFAGFLKARSEHITRSIERLI